MKKLFSTLMVVACLIMAIPAQSQVRFGVKGGLDVSKINTDWAESSTGFFVGPMVDFTLPVVGLGIDAAALYSQSGIKFEGTSKDNLKTIEVPVNLKWTVGLGSTLGLFVAAGPQFGFGLNDSDKLLDYNKAFVSVNVGAGLKLLRHLQLGVNYNFGASKVGSIIAEGNDRLSESYRKNSWQVSLAYIF